MENLQPQYLPWSQAQAEEWHARTPWRVGCNYNPAYATSPLEFWHADYFDANAIATELDLAQQIGFNSLRVYLHDQLWQDEAGFLNRLDTFLDIANQRGIGVLFVLFDSCWYPFPDVRAIRTPLPGFHNSGWVQSPGVEVLVNQQFDSMKAYVTGVASHFKDDQRIHGWDIWNEPDNPNTSSYGNLDLGERKGDFVLPCLIKTFDWVRGSGATQPVTCGVWHEKWTPDQASPVVKLSLTYSDINSFHWYESLETTRERVEILKAYKRPLLCTEYMARGAGSTFHSILPYFKAEKIAAYNWGFVQGRTQTHLPWDSWQKPYANGEPSLWFHEVFRADHTPYRTDEVELIRSLTHAS